jgi:acyl-CoA thioesterase I
MLAGNRSSAPEMVLNMSGRRLSVRLAVSMLLFAFLIPVPASASEPVRIMPLGDSITEGANGDATYRYFLWHLLGDAGYQVDFVGSMTGVKGRRAQPKYPDFDQNHEGHSGWTAGKIANYSMTFAQQSGAQVVLLHAGTNDINRGIGTNKIKSRIQKVITQLRLVNPEIDVFVAELIPIAGMEPQVVALNAAIRSLASQMDTSGSRVIAVDLNSGFNVGSDLRDGIHPTESGYVKMADAWFGALDAYLSGG